MKMLSLFSLSMLPIVTTSVVASEVDIPHLFQSGTPAVAAEVNGNFSVVEGAIDDNYQMISALQMEIAALKIENQSLQAQIDGLVSGQQSVVAVPVFPRGAGPNYTDFALFDGKGVFTVQFNVQVNPDTFVSGKNVVLEGSNGLASGSVSWLDNFTTLRYTMDEAFIDVSPCFSGGLEFKLLSPEEGAPKDVHGKAVDGDRDGLPGGEFSVVYDLVC